MLQRLRISSLTRAIGGLWSRRLIVDVVVIFGTAILLRYATYDQDLFERFYRFSRAHEAWELDEAVFTLTILSIALIVFGIRRIQDQRRELRLRETAERRVATLANHDSLTGLPNRRRFREAVSAMVTRPGGLDAIMLIDLDGFTPINDAMGQEGGDETLRVVADRLRPFAGQDGMAARVGGDEFGLLLLDMQSPERVRQVAEAVIAVVGEPVLIGDKEYRLRASIGVAPVEHAGPAPEMYFRHANLALHQAKRERSGCVLYDVTMDVEQQERFRIEQDLRRGLREDQLKPYYQPIVDLASGNVVKLEALARWKHPTRGFVPPFRFVSVAEECGMIEELTETILRQACRDALTWPPSIALSVNLSPVLLSNQAFPHRLIAILEETHLPPGRLELEITESTLEAELDFVRPFMARLRSLGVQMALDDFGTGYSSLSRLQDLQFDEVKIDRHFTQGITNPESAVIIRSIIQLAQGLGMCLTAEGVEKPEQRDWLLHQGCQHGQGYLFGSPVPAEEVGEMLRRAGVGVRRMRDRLQRKAIA